MSKSLSKRVSVFLSIDRNTILNYFNVHDPAPIYKRQLAHDFEDYIMTSVAGAKRYSVIRYKLSYVHDSDQRFSEPLMHAIRRHFTVKKIVREAEFEKFKRRTYTLLGISLAVVMICQGLLPLLLVQQHRIHSTLSNSLDVFSWVILWRPIDKLIFHWNPHLKEIALLEKLSNAEVISVEKEPV
jgi:hypothetical protein